jgi:hypothetical protein
MVFNLRFASHFIDVCSSANDPKFAHLTDEDVKKVDQAFKQSYQWLEQTRQKSVNAPKHLAPPVTVAQIRQEKNEFESTVSPILNKPPPKAPSPPKEQQKSPAEEKTQQAQNAQEQQNQQQNQTQENMEWSSN